MQERIDRLEKRKNNKKTKKQNKFKGLCKYFADNYPFSGIESLINL